MLRFTFLKAYFIGFLLSICSLSAQNNLGDFPQWTVRAATKSKKSEAQNVVYNNKLYVFNGIRGYKFTDGSTTIYLNNSTECYNPATNTWTLLSPIPDTDGLTHYGIQVVDDEAWLVGGRLKATKEITNRVWIYNFQNDTWRRGPDLPLRNASGLLIKLGRKLHYFAGGTFTGTNVNTFCTMTDIHLVLDLENQNLGWASLITNFPEAAKGVHAGSVAIGGKFYFFGGQVGHDCGNTDKGNAFVFNPVDNSWQSIAPLPYINSHLEFSSFALDGKLIIVAGEDVGSDIYEYNPETDTWTKIDILPIVNGKQLKLIGPAAKVIGDKLIIANGGVNCSTYTPTDQTYIKNFPRTYPKQLGFLPEKIELQPNEMNLQNQFKAWLWTLDGKVNYNLNLLDLPNWLSISKDPGSEVDPNAVEFKINIIPQNLQPGTNTFSLIASASGYANAKLDIIVKTNVAPTVSAGADRSINLPQNYIRIYGNSDDSDGQLVSKFWTQISGPSSATLLNANTDTLRAENLLQGNYIFRLTATDNLGATAFDEMKVSVLGGAAPIVNAGADKVINLPLNQTNLSGSANDVDGNISTYQWSQTTGPNTANIQNANNSQATISNLIAGNYTFRLTAWDNDNLSDFDEVNVLVNQAPLVEAGSDQNFKSPPQDSTQLNGQASDNDGFISQIQWSQVSGPSTALLVSPTALSTKVKNLLVGTYIFRLQATDNQGNTTFDDIVVKVDMGQQMIAAFFLVDADNDVIIRKMKDNEMINMSTLNAQGIQNINIRANTQPSKVGSVRLILSGKESRVITENGSPYTLFGDTNGNYSPWNPSTGSYTLTATPYTLMNAGGVIGIPSSINFSVTRNTTLKSNPVLDKNENLNESKIYPNPFHNELTIKDLEKYGERLDVLVEDLNGKILFTKNYKSNPQLIQLNLKSLPAGMYLLIINGQKLSEAFQIEKL
jgi:N-acetylneuraminic acid mutarotase